MQTSLGSNLSGARFIKAVLFGAEFSKANLSGADLSHAMVGDTVFGGVDLSKALGLETVDHSQPSLIGIDTIYKSKGQIPEIFLRDAGVPESFIEKMKDLVGTTEPIQSYSCVISHSNKDGAFAKQLQADLRAKGVRCWRAAEDLKIGDRSQESIAKAIRDFDKVMVVLSAASVKSRWVEHEVNLAREREDREDLTILFPIQIDESVVEAPQPWAADIRLTRHIGNFCDWHHDPTYREAFDRLLRDLKASAVTTTE